MSDHSDDINIPWRKVILIFFALILVGLALDWVYAGQNFFLYKFWAPKQEQVRREVYEQTKSYRKGSADRLSYLCGQVRTADDNQRGLLNEQIKQEFSDFNNTDVPDYLRACLTDARAN